MKYFSPFLILALVFTSLAAANPASAGECWADPYFEVSGTASVTSAVFIRSGPCQSGTEVLGTASGGSTVPVLAENHGWYLIELPNGTKGWSYQSFFNAGSLSLTSSSRASIESKFPVGAGTPSTPPPPPETDPLVEEPTVTPVAAPVSSSLLERVKGRILLQVESVGEAWYVHPEDGRRYYMKDGPTAYEMMRAFGLGISSKDFANLVAGNQAMNQQLRGKIVLEVEKHGEAHYIHPVDGSIHYLKDGAAAYQIMRNLSLGITNKDLSTITSKTFVPLAPSTTPSPSNPSPLAISTFQRGEIPSNIDLMELNRYWLQKVNSLRAERGLRQLVLDQRWIDTATEWAVYMGENDERSHDRPDGKSMHQWIDTKGLDFTTRYSQNGWRTNYFTENISWDYSQNSMTSLKQALDNTMAFYLSEEDYDGPHYRTTYHEDWNSVGVGFYFAPKDNGGYTVYMAYHYGSLNL